MNEWYWSCILQPVGCVQLCWLDCRGACYCWCWWESTFEVDNIEPLVSVSFFSLFMCLHYWHAHCSYGIEYLVCIYFFFWLVVGCYHIISCYVCKSLLANAKLLVLTIMFHIKLLCRASSASSHLLVLQNTETAWQWLVAAGTLHSLCAAYMTTGCQILLLLFFHFSASFLCLLS